MLIADLTLHREQDFAFYLAARDDDGRISGSDIRKIGNPLSKDRKVEAGINFRGTISREFYATLNDRGRADPIESAHTIASFSNGLLQSHRQLSSISEAGCFAEFFPSNSAAGPCSSALALSGVRIDPGRALFVPLDDCTHPGQCACMYQARLSPDGEF